ncbi:response regulator [Kamptonema formosum]|uniref:response regulator n=1 Tax=Kamptonema formosum TaxID=331992 RepID=UPI00035D20CD|nr:response regulator [Oscillatoria sp. PCC 10802]
MKILLVEDDEHLAKTLEIVLSEQHHTIDVAKDGLKGWDLAEAFTYDLILLDVMLPKLDGITLCRRMRSARMSVPIMLLTAKDSSSDKVMGFDAGADDYVVKPFDPQELVARIRALLRRGKAPLPPVLEWGGLRLDPSTCEVSHGEHLLHLTPKEYGLLELFMRNSNRVFSRSAILEQLWSFEEPPAEETVRAHIKGLRQKLKSAGAPTDLIETVYGLGYRLKPEPPPARSSAGAAQEQQEAARARELNGGGKPHPQSADRASKPAPATQESDRRGSLSSAAEEAPNSFSPAATQQKIEEAVSELWKRFKEPSKKRVAEIERAVAALQEGRLSEDLRNRAISEAHKLAGSLGTYGFPLGSKLARNIEHALINPRLSQEQVPHLWEMVQSLHRQLESPPALAVSCRLPESSATPTASPSEAPHSQLSLLLIVSDHALAAQLSEEARSLGMRDVEVPDWCAARIAFASAPPDVVVLDLSCADTASEGLQLLSELTGRSPEVPVLVLTGRNGFADRVEVARRGGRAFLQKPVSPALVMDAVLDVLQRPAANQSKVMIVDDDLEVLEALRALLKPWGFKLTTLEDPNQFWDTLESSVPDLLVLDVEMPEHSGIELCQVVRNDPCWSGLPVLFLTAHSDADTLHKVFAAGADDYVTKPVVGPELVTRILNRLERTQLIRSMAESDPLTGLANRRKSIQDLGQLLRLADRYSQPLCLAVMDVDRLKQIHDQYGHAASETVLRRLGELLHRHFRSEDVVARWGGEEFVAGMYGMSKLDGLQRLKELLDSFSQQEFTGSKGETFRATFSAGVAEYPREGSDLQTLYRSADAALEEAKAAGRNCVVPAH